MPKEAYVLCAVLGEKYGHWPHEILLCRNDPPGPIEMALMMFNIQCTRYHMDAIEKAEAEAQRKLQRKR